MPKIIYVCKRVSINRAAQYSAQFAEAAKAEPRILQLAAHVSVYVRTSKNRGCAWEAFLEDAEGLCVDRLWRVPNGSSLGPFIT